MPMSSKFLTESIGEKIVKIDQYLAKIWTKYDSLLFFGPPCIYIACCCNLNLKHAHCASRTRTRNVLSWHLKVECIVFEMVRQRVPSSQTGMTECMSCICQQSNSYEFRSVFHTSALRESRQYEVRVEWAKIH